MSCTKDSYCVYDINSDMVEKARKIGIKASICDVSENPLDDTYDYVFASDVIEHVGNIEGFMKNISSSCTGWGYMILTTPNAVYFRNCITDRWSELDEHICTFNRKHFQNWSRRLNIKTIELCTFQAMPYRFSFRVRCRIPIYRFMEKVGRANSI